MVTFEAAAHVYNPASQGAAAVVAKALRMPCSGGRVGVQAGMDPNKIKKKTRRVQVTRVFIRVPAYLRVSIFERIALFNSHPSQEESTSTNCLKGLPAVGRVLRDCLQRCIRGSSGSLRLSRPDRPARGCPVGRQSCRQTLRPFRRL